MMDGWDVLNQGKTFDETMKDIHDQDGREWVDLTKENHARMSLHYCTKDDGWSYNPPLTSWYVEYYDHNKGKETVARLVAGATNKQVRAFLSRLDKVQDFKAQCYKAALERKEKRETKEAFIKKYMATNCSTTEAEVQKAKTAYDKRVEVVEDKVTKLNTEFETTVINEVFINRYNKRPLYFQSVGYITNLGDSDVSWEDSYKRLVEDDMYLRFEEDFGFKESNDIIKFAKFIVKVDAELDYSVRYAKLLLKKAVKLKSIWDKTSKQAESVWADKK